MVVADVECRAARGGMTHAGQHPHRTFALDRPRLRNSLRVEIRDEPDDWRLVHRAAWRLAQGLRRFMCTLCPNPSARSSTLDPGSFFPDKAESCTLVGDMSVLS